MSAAVDRYLVLLQKLDKLDTETDDDGLYDELDAAYYALSEDEHGELDRRLDIRTGG